MDGDAIDMNADEGKIKLAAPSWVIPGDVSANARFLSGVVDGCALCLFETAGSLKYDEKDLPQSLAELPLEWHLHLPCDLPEDSAEAAASICLKLERKTRFLKPTLAVLHPPSMGDAESKKKYLRTFFSRWREESPLRVALENTSSCDLIELGEDFFDQEDCGICLDMAHALGYEQDALLRSTLPERAEIAHWSAPRDGDHHASLRYLTGDQREILRDLARRMPTNAIHLLEVFSWEGVETSLPALRDILAKK